MLPTLKMGQDVLVFNCAYIFSKPKVGDIVVVKVNGEEMVKRLHKVDDRTVNVKGDNEEDSLDSKNFGSIKVSDIIGKVVWTKD